MANHSSLDTLNQQIKDSQAAFQAIASIRDELQKAQRTLGKMRRRARSSQQQFEQAQARAIITPATK